MTTSYLYHTQGTRGYKLRKTEYIAGTAIHYLHSKSRHISCPECSSLDTLLVETGGYGVRSGGYGVRWFATDMGSGGLRETDGYGVRWFVGEKRYLQHGFRFN